jgi:hypothetical protein
MFSCPCRWGAWSVVLSTSCILFWLISSVYIKIITNTHVICSRFFCLLGRLYYPVLIFYPGFVSENEACFFLSIVLEWPLFIESD